MARKYRKWTKTDQRTLFKMTSEGASINAIAKKLGRSGNLNRAKQNTLVDGVTKACTDQPTMTTEQWALKTIADAEKTSNNAYAVLGRIYAERMSTPDVG